MARTLQPLKDTACAVSNENDHADIFENVSALTEALHHLPIGVATFGPDSRLKLCNRQYLRMYQLADGSVWPGMAIEELIESRKAARLFEGDVGKYCRGIQAIIARGQTHSQHIDTPDGRTMHVLNQPLPGGGWVVTHEDVTEHFEAERKAEFLANHDALTELPNRAMLKLQLDEALRQRGRKQQLAVFFLDLDNFKGINDTLGHKTGDELLQEVARSIKGCVRDNDLVGRLGGDEFVVVLTDVEKPEAAAALASRLRQSINRPIQLTDHEIFVDVSIGIAMAPEDGTSYEQLLKCADMALYGAKAGGRGIYRFFEQEMDEKMAARRELELELRRALVNREFELYYQPLINFEEDRICGCEALLRWHHPERGLVEPTEFIGVAEEMGIIARIGEWVIREACLEATNWPDDVSIAVNVSPVQFKSQDLIRVVANALAATGLSAERLQIEITETILLDDTDEVLVKLSKLRDLGVRIAMDDFGTGYSSLSYLQKFPFDKIKIDQSFMAGLADEGDSNAIVGAVASMAKSLKMTTTAEGVETQAQCDIVKALGCTEMQGYLLSKACVAAEVAKLIEANQGATPDAA
jgi:diguanylate cyclase (GGDEF)-like protein